MNLVLNAKETGIIATNGATAGRFSNEYYIIEDTHSKEKYVVLKLKSSYALYNYKYHDKISSLSWHLHKTGYITHTINNTFTEMYPDCYNIKSDIYLHKFIMIFCKNLKQTEDTVDHINWRKNDNREENLRWASQSDQNSNRDTRCDKKLPFDELIEIGIDKYPKYCRYDNSQNRFIIEKHPALIKKVENNKINKPVINGTRTGTLKNKLKNICIKGNELDSEINLDIYRIQMKKDALKLTEEYKNIFEFCKNTLSIDIGNKEYLPQPLFIDVIALIEDSEKIKDEEWIDYTPGDYTYKISNKGRIKLLNGIITNGTIIKGTKYSQVQISLSKKTTTVYNKKKYYVHKLVYEAFNGDTNKNQIIYDNDAPKINGVYRNWLEDMKLVNSKK